ncbi:MAG: TlpA family protein disulfide reductase [Candidatus Tectomicrobia bacterium]|nr:TlpA family protein disulfide reductase [Candidatus Tectomicrobia bacterium]
MKELMAKLLIFQPPERVPLDEFELKDLDGKSVRFSSFRGKVVLVNLWATWCSYCEKERPHLEALYRKYKDRGFVVVAISIDVEGAAAVRPYVEKRKLSFVHLLDPESEIARGYFGLRGTPTNYFVDRAGNAVGAAIGYRDWSSPGAHRLIELLLDEDVPPSGIRKKEAKHDGKEG